jgi:hypothetical protein
VFFVGLIMKRKAQICNLIQILFSLGIVFCILYPVSPLNMPFTYRDSGVFLYSGWRIINGDLPYRDFWDHKPPVIFFINALGLLITNNSRWGVWLIEFIGLFLAALLGFKLVRKVFGIFPAIFSQVIWLLSLIYTIKGGNLTTEYTLPLQFLALWLIRDADKDDFPFSRWFFIGFVGSIAFFTKQNTIGIWIAIVIFLLYRRIKIDQKRKSLIEIIFFFFGGLTFSLCLVLFFVFQGVILEFWSAAFEYNFVYSLSSRNILDRVKPIVEGVSLLTKTGLFQFAMIGYIAGLLLYKEMKTQVKQYSALLLVLLIDLPIEFILISVSGRTYYHYYMTLLPVLAFFSAITFWMIINSLRLWKVESIIKWVFMISVVIILIWSSYADYKNQLVTFNSIGDKFMINYISSNSNFGDYVLLWGAESSINFFTERESPGKYVYQYPLFTDGYVNEQMILEFLEDIIQKKPKLIIDTNNSFTPFFDFPIHTEEIDKKFRTIKYCYNNIGKINAWKIYEYKGD